MEDIKQRDKVTIIRNIFESVKELDFNQQGVLYNAIFEYCLNFNEVKLEGLDKVFFNIIKLDLDRNNAKYLNGTKYDAAKLLKLKTYVYIAKLTNDEESFVKIGMTLNEIPALKIRYNKNGYAFEIIKFEELSNRTLASNKEKSYHKKFMQYSYVPKNNFTGYTECFDIKILKILEITDP